MRQRDNVFKSVYKIFTDYAREIRNFTKLNRKKGTTNVMPGNYYDKKLAAGIAGVAAIAATAVVCCYITAVIIVSATAEEQ